MKYVLSAPAVTAAASFLLGLGLTNWCQHLGAHASPVAPRLVVTVETTREVASQFSSRWDIAHGERLWALDGHGRDADRVKLSVVVNDPSDVRALLQLESEGVLLLGEERGRMLDGSDWPGSSGRSLLGINDEFSCYRTANETYASIDAMAEEYPNFVTVTSIGDSYLKSTGEGGDDIKLIILSAPSSAPKSDLMIVGGHHVRELPPPETILRWAEYLLDRYNKDADVTWILERTNIHMVPLANPDGRNIVQEHLDWMYRKNARPNSCSVGPSLWGTDLNRNYPMFWGLDSGSSDDPCSTQYRGESSLSEPESTAVYEYAKNLFSPAMKKGTVQEATEKINDACPVNASGIFLDVHSSGNIIYFPWGIQDKLAPNHRALLTMSSKLAKPGNYSLWGPAQDGFLYFVSGDATDATYGIDCIPSFGYEVGSQWYANCTELENDIVPTVHKSFMYAAKCVKAPYMIPLGPDIMSIAVTQGGDDNNNTDVMVLTVVASDEANIVGHAIFQDNTKSQLIDQVYVYVDQHPDDDDDGSQRIPMTAKDGSFDSVTEVAQLTLNTTTWTDGSRHVLYFQATDVQGEVGAVSAIFVVKESDGGNGTIGGGEIPVTGRQGSELPRAEDMVTEGSDLVSSDAAFGMRGIGFFLLAALVVAMC